MIWCRLSVPSRTLSRPAKTSRRRASMRAGGLRGYLNCRTLMCSASANKSAQQEETVVVSDDPRLVRALEHGKAKLERALDFIRTAKSRMRGEEKQSYEEPDEKFSGLTDRDVDGWMSLFKGKRK
jgi:hypothetical protein